MKNMLTLGHRRAASSGFRTNCMTNYRADWFAACLITLMIASSLPGITATAYAQSNPQTLRVEADQQLEWHRDDQQYIARGNAVLTTQEMTLKAETITADYTDTPDKTADNSADSEEPQNSKNRIISITGSGQADIIYLDAQGQETHGQAETIHYDRQEDILTLTGMPASGVIRVTRDGNITEANNSITYHRATGIITNIGDTATKFTDGRQIFGDKAVTITNPEDGKIMRITITGNARILHPDTNGSIQEATGDHAIYDATTDTVTVTGNVILTEADNILQGDKAVMKIGEGTSVLSSDSDNNRVSGKFILE